MARTKQPTKELPARGSFVTLLTTAMLTVLSITAAYLIRVAAIHSGLSDDMEKIAQTHRFIDRDIALRSDYTGIALVDQGIGTLIAAFMGGPAGWDVGFQVQMAYFLVSFFSVISIWTVESVRKRNEAAWIT